ncbi:Uncharacterised protein [Enterobacter cancerogenus]|uniref:Uncharacterized protein n=1 Tax=Enterobacter cancerogenus TaxID=69218 RepID=A0A484WVT8_9ENTR|nr:Uncharacterised protein [Enterobacter cancerogenus]
MMFRQNQKKLFKKTHKLTNVPILDDINKKFKMIMCNHVINSMENIAELYFLFKTLHSLLLSKGIVLITINHPLFIYESHKYYSCSSTHLNYNDGVQLFTTVYDNNKGCIVFGDVYWSYDTILDVIERVGFITLKKKLLKYMAGITHLIFNLY